MKQTKPQLTTHSGETNETATVHKKNETNETATYHKRYETNETATDHTLK